MNFLNSIISDLRSKRLWPIAAVLLVAVIAVPVLLSSGSSSTPTPVAQVPPQSGGATPIPGTPVLSVNDTPSHAKITGKARNPFTQQHVASASSGSTGASSSGSSGSGA